MATERLMDNLTAATPPIEGQLARELPYFHEGLPAEHPFGVLYQGEFETVWDGTAIAVRAHARALAATGIPVLLRSFSHVVANEHGALEPAHLALSEAVEREVGELRKASIGTLTPLIKHAVISTAEHARNILIPRGAVALGGDILESVQLRRAICANTILYTVWERDNVSSELGRELNRSAQLWVPCNDNMTTLVRAGVDKDKVHVVPHPFDEQDLIHKLVQRIPHNHGWRLFYSIGRWEPRKAYAELILAFLRAFTPQDRVVLTLKYSGGRWPGYPTPAEAIQSALADPVVVGNGWTSATLDSRLVIWTDRVPRSKIIELHYKNNIYVCSSRGEAFCEPALDAKLAGNRLVYVDYGAMRSFAERDDVALTDWSFMATPSSYNWEPQAVWAGYELPHLVQALRRATVPQHFEHHNGLERFHPNAIGAQMRELVMKVVEASNPKAAAYFRSKSGDAA